MLKTVAIVLRVIAILMAVILFCVLIEPYFHTTEVIAHDPEKIRAENFGEHGKFLRDADRLEVFSIASGGTSERPDEPATDQDFHGFQIYGMTQVTEKDEIESIWSEVYDRIYSDTGVRYTYCFWPRHAIRAFRGTDSLDYLICFECQHLHVYEDPEGDDYERIGLEHVSGSLKLNEILDQARIPRERALEK